MVYVVIFQISKAYEYLSVLRGKEKSRKQTNRVNGFLMITFLVLGLIAVWYCNEILYPKTLLPQGASSVEGKQIDKMLYITLAVTGGVFLLTHILLFWFSYRYQEKEGRRASYYPHNNTLEIIWTTVPAICLTGFIVYGLTFWFKITKEAPKDSVVVEITGKQFAWEFRYPGKDGVLGKKNVKKYNQPAGNSLAVDFDDPESWDDIHVSEMHIPVNRPVKLVINSMDVIHDVGLVAFRMKMDAVPGIPTTIWFTPTRTTKEMKKITGNPNYVYEISCDQMCGKGHFSMRGVIVVETEAEYNRWLAKQKPEYYTLFPDKDPSNNVQTAPAADSSATATPLAAILPGK